MRAVYCTEKRSFRHEMQMRIDEGHMCIDLRIIHVRTYNLSTYYKNICIDTVDLPYRSSQDMTMLLDWDTSIEVEEDDTFDFHLFIAKIAIIAKYKAAIEGLCRFKLDLERYTYYLHARWVDLTYKEREWHIEGLNIIYVDDHPVFSKGLEKIMKEKYFPDSIWSHFTETDEALKIHSEKIG